MLIPSSRRASFAAVLLAGSVLGGLGAALRPALAENQGTPIVAPAVPALAGFGDLVVQVRPAVVTITSTERVKAEQARSPFPPGSEQDNAFRQHFG